MRISECGMGHEPLRVDVQEAGDSLKLLGQQVFSIIVPHVVRLLPGSFLNYLRSRNFFSMR